jgi:hypothetical protein
VSDHFAVFSLQQMAAYDVFGDARRSQASVWSPTNGLENVRALAMI